MMAQWMFAELNDQPPPMSLNTAMSLDNTFNMVDVVGTGTAALPMVAGIGTGIGYVGAAAKTEMCSAAANAAPALGRAALLSGSLLAHNPAETEIVFGPISDVVEQIETLDSISEEVQLESQAQNLNPTTISPTK